MEARKELDQKITIHSQMVEIRKRVSEATRGLGYAALKAEKQAVSMTRRGGTRRGDRAEAKDAAGSGVEGGLGPDDEVAALVQQGMEVVDVPLEDVGELGDDVRVVTGADGEPVVLRRRKSPDLDPEFEDEAADQQAVLKALQQVYAQQHTRDNVEDLIDSSERAGDERMQVRAAPRVRARYAARRPHARRVPPSPLPTPLCLQMLRELNEWLLRMKLSGSDDSLQRTSFGREPLRLDASTIIAALQRKGGGSAAGSSPGDGGGSRRSKPRLVTTTAPGGKLEGGSLVAKFRPLAERIKTSVSILSMMSKGRGDAAGGGGGGDDGVDGVDGGASLDLTGLVDVVDLPEEAEVGVDRDEEEEEEDEVFDVDEDSGARKKRSMLRTASVNLRALQPQLEELEKQVSAAAVRMGWGARLTRLAGVAAERGG